MCTVNCLQYFTRLGLLVLNFWLSARGMNTSYSAISPSYRHRILIFEVKISKIDIFIAEDFSVFPNRLFLAQNLRPKG